MQNLENKQVLKSISTEDVYDFLKGCPDFFLLNADLLEELKLPTSSAGNVTSFNDFQLIKLKNKIAKLEERNKLLIHTSLQNHQSEREINNLVLNILQTESLNTLQEELRKNLTSTMHLESVILHTAGDNISAFKEDENVRLRSMLSEEERAIHGESTPILSDAHIQLSHNGQWFGTLILGSVDGTHFHIGQGTEILDFLGKVLGYKIQQLNG